MKHQICFKNPACAQIAECLWREVGWVCGREEEEGGAPMTDGFLSPQPPCPRCPRSAGWLSCSTESGGLCFLLFTSPPSSTEWSSLWPPPSTTRIRAVGPWSLSCCWLGPGWGGWARGHKSCGSVAPPPHTQGPLWFGNAVRRPWNIPPPGQGVDEAEVEKSPLGNCPQGGLSLGQAGPRGHLSLPCPSLGPGPVVSEHSSRGPALGWRLLPPSLFRPGPGSQSPLGTAEFQRAHSALPAGNAALPGAPGLRRASPGGPAEPCSAPRGAASPALTRAAGEPALGPLAFSLALPAPGGPGLVPGSVSRSH